jgi:hypothetical protein
MDPLPRQPPLDGPEMVRIEVFAETSRLESIDRIGIAGEEPPTCRQDFVTQERRRVVEPYQVDVVASEGLDHLRPEAELVDELDLLIQQHREIDVTPRPRRATDPGAESVDGLDPGVVSEDGGSGGEGVVHGATILAAQRSNKALDLLSRRPHFRRELAAKLASRGYHPSEGFVRPST